MKKLTLALALLCGLAAPRIAHADSGSAIALGDAGVPLDGGSVLVTTTATPIGATTQTTISLPPDPIAHPLDFLAALKDTWAKSWGIALGFAVYGLIELLAHLGKSDPTGKLAWLGKGRTSVVIGALAAVMPTFIAALTGAGAWTAFFASLLTGAAAVWHPAGQDPAKA